MSDVDIEMSQYGGVTLSLPNDYIELSKSDSKKLLKDIECMLTKGNRLKNPAPPPINFFTTMDCAENNFRKEDTAMLRSCLECNIDAKEVASVFGYEVDLEFIQIMSDWCAKAIKFHNEIKPKKETK